MELLGSGYVVEHCAAAYVQRQKQEMFEDYLTEELRYIAQQLGVKMSKTLHEQRNPKHDIDDDKPVEDVVEDRIKRLGLTVRRGDSDGSNGTASQAGA